MKKNLTSSALRELSDIFMINGLSESAATAQAIHVKYELMESTIRDTLQRLKKKSDFVWERCKDFDPDCIECKAWAIIDELEDALSFDPLSK